MAFLTSHTMPAEERELVEARLVVVEKMMGEVLAGEMQKVMNELHVSPEDPEVEEDQNQEEKK